MPGVYYYQLDLTDFAAIESTAELIRREHGDPTVLINNAGTGECQTILQILETSNSQFILVPGLTISFACPF